MKKRMDSIQALRFLACLCIFSHHCYIYDNVFWGVEIFFVLSGFLMAYSYYPRPALDRRPIASLRFAAKKVKKLYPLHILTMLPILALAIYAREDMKYVVTGLIENVLLIQAWSPEYAISLNGVAWYLSVCAFLYFMFPCILACLRSYRSRKTAFIACGVLFIAEFAAASSATPLGKLIYGADADLTKYTEWFGYISPLFRLLDFAVGCNVGYIFLTRSENEFGGKKALGTAEIICAALFVAAVLISKSESFLSADEYSRGFLYLPFACAVVYLFADGKGAIPRLLTNRVTVYLGNISACFFLIHQDVIRITYMLLDRFYPGMAYYRLILFVVCGIVSVALSAAYMKLEELIRHRATRAYNQ